VHYTQSTTDSDVVYTCDVRARNDRTTCHVTADTNCDYRLIWTGTFSGLATILHGAWLSLVTDVTRHKDNITNFIHHDSRARLG